MGRRNFHRAARGPFILGLVHEAIERGERNIEAAYRGVRLPKDRDAVRRLADTCLECGEVGHQRRACPALPCYLCGEPGHRQRRCPQRAK